MRIRFLFAGAAALLCIAASPVRAGWLDAAWPYRRAIEIGWNAEHASGEELAVVEFYTAGHAKPNAQDVRVASEEGRVVPSRVLGTGPGDLLRVVFALQRPFHKYFVYFGNPNPPPPPKGTEDVGYRCGVFVDMHVWTGGRVNDPQQIEASWERSKEVVGQTFIDTFFLGLNPFDERAQVIAKTKGSYFAPMDGDYLFAGSALSRAVLYIDGKQVLFIPGYVGDIRFNAKVALKRGRHDIAALWVCEGGDPRLSIVCQRPDEPKPGLLGREELGQLGLVNLIGPLDEHDKTLTADFSSDYAGECFYEDHYSFRYRFTSDVSKALAATAHADWDFGDGQTATGPSIDHVYLTDGEYPVKLTIRVGGNSDTQTTRFIARRDRTKIINPPTDEPPVQSAIVAKYDMTRAPVTWLPWAVMLHQRAKAVDPMLAVADRLARLQSHLDPAIAMQALMDATHEALDAGKVSPAMGCWDAIPANSNIKAPAARYQAELLLWRTGEFAKAVQVLEPYANTAGAEIKLRRLYGDALVLSQKVEAGRKILNALPIEGQLERQAAISGAMARTVEFFITTGDWESGQEAWEKWQSRCPAEFLEGYGVVLETRLMELAKSSEGAARLAEAFATAMPRCSYSPELLDRASKLLAQSDPEHSKSLRQTLKQRYPEDPLSQDTPG